MLTVRTQKGQLIETIQVMARSQEELRHATSRAAATNPSVTLMVNPLVGTNPPIVTHPPVVTHPPPEGGRMNQNTGPTFKIPLNGGG